MQSLWLAVSMPTILNMEYEKEESTCGSDGEDRREGPGKETDRETQRGNSKGRSRGSLGKPKTTYVYFVETKDGQYIKIGCSFRIYGRLRQLSTSPHPGNGPLRLVGYFPGTTTTEKWLHLKFSGHRQSGEWFRDATEILEFMSAIGLIPPIAAELKPTRPTKPAASVGLKSRGELPLFIPRNTKITAKLREELSSLREVAELEKMLGGLMRDWRSKRNWGQRELAERLQVSAQYVCDVEHGRRGIGTAVRERLEQLVGI